MVNAVTPKKGLDFLVVGLGMMGSIAPPILRQAGGSVIGVLGIDNKEVDEYVAKTRIPDLRFTGTFQEYENLLGRGDFNAVFVAVPNYLHAKIGIQALQAGKHVLIEKPLATTVKDAEEFYKVAVDSGRAVEVNSQYRHHEIFRMLRKMIDDGEVDQVEMGYIQGWQADPTQGIGWRPEVAVAGRGKLVGDLGTHVLETTLALFGGEFIEFAGRTYNVHAKRFKPKTERVGSFGGASIPGPDVQPDLWEEMDMFDRDKYSGDDRAEAYFKLKTRSGQTINGKYILSQVDTGDEKMGNENNFYIRVIFKDGREVRWFQEDPNHLDVLKEGKAYQRIERSSPWSMTGRPGGHPHGYGDAILLEATRMYDVVESGDAEGIRAYTEKNVGQALEAVRKIDQWLQKPLEPYTNQLDKWLDDVRALRVAA